MDQESQQLFDTLRKTDPEGWSKANRDFMNARRDYLSEEEVEAFGLGEESSKSSAKPYSKMTVEELKAIAAEKNVEIAETDKKADLVAKLEAADSASQIGMVGTDCRSSIRRWITWSVLPPT